jgi:hypothetical protein
MITESVSKININITITNTKRVFVSIAMIQRLAPRARLPTSPI